MSSESNVDLGRFVRILTLIALVTAISFFLAADALSTPLQSMIFVGVGAVSLVSAITGFFIAAGASVDAAETRREERLAGDREPTEPGES